MPNLSMEKKYNHNKIESEQQNFFVQENNKIFKELSTKNFRRTNFPEFGYSSKKSPFFSPFVCLLPPPNITGKLHLGHM